VLAGGVLTFDGEVVEAFGFGRDKSVRTHVALIQEIDFDQGGRFTKPSVTFKPTDGLTFVSASFSEEEAGSSEVAALVDAVRTASPNLKEG
jgi:hypothetical protein